MRVVVIALLVVIALSLFSALGFLLRDRGRGPTRMATALSIRVGLSVALFVLLMAGHYFGLIPGKL